MEVAKFLNEVYKGCTEGYITLMTIPERDTYWFKATETDQAAKKAVELGKTTNTFFGVGLRKQVLSFNLRGNEDDILSVPALYADIDIKGEAHAEHDLPENRDVAMQFMKSLPIPASIIVWSGNGLHAYWLLDQPFIISSQESKKKIQGIMEGWGRHVNERAKMLGWRLDSVYDLPRVLRVPETVNHKTKDQGKCLVMESSLKRYELSVFERYQTLKKPIEERIEYKNAQAGSAERILEKCSFMQHCKTDAMRLPEPHWHAMISNLSLAKDGPEVVHALSSAYPKYDKAETAVKIKRAIKENKPHTCSYIQDRLGFTCGFDCKVKAPVVHGVASKEDLVREYVAKEVVSADLVFTEENIKLMAYAKIHLPAEYAKYKMKLKNKVSIRDFEAIVKHQLQEKHNAIAPEKDIPLYLDGLQLQGAVLPHGWEVTMEHGVRRYTASSEGTIVTTVCPSAIVITKRLENLDDESEKVELTFFRNKRWKRILSIPSQVFNKASIMKFADAGLPVSSDSSGELVKFLWDYELKNKKEIPMVKSISRVGWFGKQFFPYVAKDEIIFDAEHKEGIEIIKSMKKKGDYDLWKMNTIKARENAIARFLIAASFASPLLEPLQHRVFFVHIWNDSKSGKTAALKLGLSVWGNPCSLMGSFNATTVGLERMASTLNHLPFAIDELQVLNEKRLSAENIIYGLSMGFGRLRGTKEGGVQEKTQWRNIVITSGEQPLSKENSNDGALTRVFELYGRPVQDEKFAHDLHLLSETNYGHAGADYIKFLTAEISKGDAMREAYNKLLAEIGKTYSRTMKDTPSSHLDNVAMVCLGDYYASISVFGKTKESAWKEAVELGTVILANNKQLEREDTVKRAWDFVTGWIIGNLTRFTNEATPCYGMVENGKFYIIPAYLREALENNGFDFSKVTRGFKERGHIERTQDAHGHYKIHIQKRINGVSCKVIVAQLDSGVHEAIPLAGKR
jgi:uncharacterized protein (DUF927 family)